MRKLRVFLLLFIAAAAKPAWAASSPGDATFDQLQKHFLAGYLAWRPSMAVALGFHEFDGRLTDFSAASIAAERARLRQYDERLARLDPASLGPAARYDYRILRAAVQKDLFTFDDAQAYSRDPMVYANALDVNTYLKRDFAPLEQRARSIVSVLNQAPRVTAAARTNLAPVLPRPLVETAIEVADGARAFLEKDLVLALKELKNEGLRAEFTAANQRAIAEWQAYAAFLKTEKLPRATNGFALGRAKFAKLLQQTELVPLPPERVLEIGLKELRREQQLFAETAARIDPTKQPIEVFQAIQHEHPTADGLIPDTRKSLEAIRQFVVEHRIVTIPSEVRPRVEETPAYDRATSFASMDTPGPFETKATTAYYYVTPVESEWPAAQKEEWLTAFNYFTTDVVSIHEAYPGHYVQFLCLSASPANRLEKILGSYAFVEGWAHYTEQMMIEQGFGGTNDPVRAAKFHLAQLDESLLRLCRLCVAIQMHCQGMTVDEGTRFFQDHCYYEAKPARQEAMRGTFDPGYLNYTLGKLMLLKLRADYARQEGASFSLGKFHDEVLRHGMPPVPLLRELLLKDSQSWGDLL